MDLARTLDELLKVDSAEGHDGERGLRPEWRLAFVISVSVLLEIYPYRDDHERRSHRAADADKRKGEKEAEGLASIWEEEDGQVRGADRRWGRRSAAARDLVEGISLGMGLGLGHASNKGIS